MCAAIGSAPRGGLGEFVPSPTRGMFMEERFPWPSLFSLCNIVPYGMGETWSAREWRLGLQKETIPRSILSGILSFFWYQMFKSPRSQQCGCRKGTCITEAFSQRIPVGYSLNNPPSDAPCIPRKTGVSAVYIMFVNSCQFAIRRCEVVMAPETSVRSLLVAHFIASCAKSRSIPFASQTSLRSNT